MAWLQISGFGVRSQIEYYSNMDDYYLKAMNHYQEQSQHSKKMTAYERRKINSQKIAQVQFTPDSPKYKTEQMSEKDRVWNSHMEKKNVRPVWTAIDQAKESELWDE